MIIDYLVNCSADVNEKNPSGITPLSKAIEVGNMASVKCLLSHGADPSIFKVCSQLKLLEYTFIYFLIIYIHC